MQIVVHGLPWSTEWQELKDLAKQHGDAVKADVMRRPDGKSRASALWSSKRRGCPERH